MNSKAAKERPRRMWLDDIMHWTKLNNYEDIRRTAEDRRKWRTCTTASQHSVPEDDWADDNVVSQAFMAVIFIRLCTELVHTHTKQYNLYRLWCYVAEKSTISVVPLYLCLISGRHTPLDIIIITISILLYQFQSKQYNLVPAAVKVTIHLSETGHESQTQSGILIYQLRVLYRVIAFHQCSCRVRHLCITSFVTEELSHNY